MPQPYQHHQDLELAGVYGILAQIYLQVHAGRPTPVGIDIQ